MDNLFGDFYAIMNWKVSERNIGKYIILIQMDKNWDQVYIILIDQRELAFTSYEKQKGKNN